MKSTKFLSGIAAARARLVLLAATFVVAISLVAPAAASLQNPLVVSAQSGALSQGTAGSATYIVTVNRSGGTPATATMSVSGLPAGATGAFGTPSAWTPATGTGSQTVTLTVTTTAAATAGVRTLTVSAAATGSQTRSGTGTLTITGPQTITFGALPAKVFGNPDFNVSATATSGLPVSFAASGNCSVTGTLVHLTGAGSCTITASQAGNATWNPAPNVAQTFPIAPSSQTITFNPLIGKYLGDSDFNLSATASSNLAVSFAVATGDCTVSGNRVHLTGSAAGSCTITASQAGDANYNAATSVDQTFAIAVFTGIELYAVTGTATLPGQSVPVWGYSYTDAPVIQPGGPALTFNLNDPVTIRLHNQLAETTSLLFQGQDMIPDTTGVPPMETKVYSFTATRPGTYLYEAGLLPKAQHQPAMGLYGALVVRSATAGQAYDSAATAFDSDAVLLLSEIDPVLNGNPAAFDMRDFAPRYFLINGKAYPSTDPIPGAAGTKVLLRYVNAGVQHHSMATLGLTQDLIAQDGNALLFPGKRVAETVAPGKTMDTIVTLPATVSTDSRYAVYDGRLMLHNNGAPGFGGMLTFVTATGTSTGDTIGPATTAVVLTSTSVSATVSDVATGNSNVTAAEFFVDTTGVNGTGTAMVGAFGVPTVNVSGVLALTGTHRVYVHGVDAAGNWGPFQSAVINNDVTGPTTSALGVTPNPSSGSVAVVLSGTANDTASGGSNITAAEYFIGAAGANGTGVAMTGVAGLPIVAAPIASISATIPPPVAAGTIYVHSMDALGNWGPPATVDVQVVGAGAGPVTSNVSAAPNPNNGAKTLDSTNLVVRVTATIASGSLTSVGAAEGFLCATLPDSACVAGAAGTGFPFVPSDGAWDGANEVVYADIPIANIGALAAGPHTIFVRGKDAVGNWGATTAMTLMIDRTVPTVSSAALTPTASNNAPVTVTGTGADTPCPPATCVIGGGEFYIDTAGVAGSGTAMAATSATTFSAVIPTDVLSLLSAGNHRVYVRAMDAAGNWSTGTTFATLLIDRTAPTFSGISLSPASIAAGTASVGLNVNGAVDPTVAGLASGLAGGEWWFGTTNITAGTGTAFALPAANPVTQIPTASLLAGCSYAVRTRIRDVATNWSTGGNGVRTATLTVTGTLADAIFSDGFETGTLNPLTNWTSRSTNTTSRLNATAAALLVGSFGMQAQGNNTNYVQYDFAGCPAPAPTFDARFYFNPHGNTGNNQDIFVARTTGGTTVFRVRYRMSGTQSQAQIQVGTSTTNTTWTNLTNSASNRIEVVWQAAGSGGPGAGTLALYVNGAVAQQTLTTTSTNAVGGMRLGSVTSGGNSTLEYFDGFASKRSVSPLIGP